MPTVIQDKEYYRKYRETHRQEIRKTANSCYYRNKDKNREAMRRYRLIHRDRLRYETKLNNQKRRLEILEMIGMKCNSCGYSKDWRALQIDHVNSNGTQERKNMVHNWAYKFWKKALIERPNDYQVLCANCNWIKRSENNELWKKINLEVAA